MKKVRDSIEALEVCKEHSIKIEYGKDANFNREFVVVTLGFKTVAGKTLVEAINRLVDMYHTPPIDHEKFEWFEESQKYLHGIR